jgi:hypothetical protein
MKAIADLAACILPPTVWGSRGYKYLHRGRKGLSMTGSLGVRFMCIKGKDLKNTFISMGD